MNQRGKKKSQSSSSHYWSNNRLEATPYKCCECGKQKPAEAFSDNQRRKFRKDSYAQQRQGTSATRIPSIRCSDCVGPNSLANHSSIVSTVSNSHDVLKCHQCHESFPKDKFYWSKTALSFRNDRPNCRACTERRNQRPNDDDDDDDEEAMNLAQDNHVTVFQESDSDQDQAMEEKQQDQPNRVNRGDEKEFRKLYKKYLQRPNTYNYRRLNRYVIPVFHRIDNSDNPLAPLPTSRRQNDSWVTTVSSNSKENRDHLALRFDDPEKTYPHWNTEQSAPVDALFRALDMVNELPTKQAKTESQQGDEDENDDQDELEEYDCEFVTEAIQAQKDFDQRIQDQLDQQVDTLKRLSASFDHCELDSEFDLDQYEKFNRYDVVSKYKLAIETGVIPAETKGGMHTSLYSAKVDNNDEPDSTNDREPSEVAATGDENSSIKKEEG